MPSGVDHNVGFFDRFATKASTFVSRAPFFAFCVILVIVWAPSYFVFQSLDTWQLVINTLTTIVTFLLVALIQNTATRSDASTQKKLNALADAVADLLEWTASQTEDDGACSHLVKDAKELRAAVGLEDRTSTS